MKKILYASFAVLFGTMGLVACDNTDRSGTTESERVVATDSVATEYEVTETVVDYDTTTKTRSVDVDRDRDRDRDNR